MLTDSLQAEIDAALETTILLAPKGTTLKELARRAYDSERQLFERAQETWMLDRIEWLIARKRRKIVPIDPELADAQYLLPGFERIPKRITMRNGRRILLRDAILTQLREYRAALLVQITNYRNTLATKDPTKDPRIIAVDRLIGLMLPYIKGGKTVTVADVMAAEKKKHEHNL